MDHHHFFHLFYLPGHEKVFLWRLQPATDVQETGAQDQNFVDFTFTVRLGLSIENVMAGLQINPPFRSVQHVPKLMELMTPNKASQ